MQWEQRPTACPEIKTYFSWPVLFKNTSSLKHIHVAVNHCHWLIICRTTWKRQTTFSGSVLDCWKAAITQWTRSSRNASSWSGYASSLKTAINVEEKNLSDTETFRKESKEPIGEIQIGKSLPYPWSSLNIEWLTMISRSRPVVMVETSNVRLGK